MENSAKSINKRLTTSLFLSCLVMALICISASMIFNTRQQIEVINDSLRIMVKAASLSPTIEDSILNGSASADCQNLIDDLTEEFENVDGICIFTTDCTPICQSKSFPHDTLENFPYSDRFDETDTYIIDSVKIGKTRYRCAFARYYYQGKLIGYIAIHSRYSRQYATVRETIPVFLLTLIAMLIFGGIVADSYNHRLKRQLNGYNLDQYIALYDRGVDILNVMDEGILTINRAGRITYMNIYAKDFFNVPQETDEKTLMLEDIFPMTTMKTTMETGKVIYDEHYIYRNQHMLATHVPLKRNGKVTGALSMFRSAFLINEMAEQLESANSMVDSLRAYNHEFMNNLHVILGFLETDHIDEAKEFLLNGSMKSSQKISQVTHLIRQSTVTAILTGKVIRASELGIDLTITPGSYCDNLTAGISSNFYVTVLGNLLENAMEELNSHELPQKEIQLTLYVDARQTYISVLDTGTGIPEEIIDRVTERGFSTKGEGRGTGLYLINSLVSSIGGELRIESSPGEGTEFVITVDSKTEPSDLLYEIHQ